MPSCSQSKHQRHPGNDSGFTLIEVVVAMLVLGLLSIVTLSSIGAATTAVAASRELNGAAALANQMLQDAQTWGCETATGAEDPAAGTPLEPDALANVYQRCNWAQYNTQGTEVGGVPWYDQYNNYTQINFVQAPTYPQEACRLGSEHPETNWIGATPWMCMTAENDQGVSTTPGGTDRYAAQLSSYITAQGETSPGASDYCSAYSGNGQPTQIVTTVQIVWWVGAAKHQSSWSRTSAVPPDSAYWWHQTGTAGSICDTSNPGAVAMAVPQTAGTNPNGLYWYIIRLGAAGAAWYPELPVGTGYQLAWWDTGGSPPGWVLCNTSALDQAKEVSTSCP